MHEVGEEVKHANCLSAMKIVIKERLSQKIENQEKREIKSETNFNLRNNEK
jgi:hypothetical protein